MLRSTAWLYPMLSECFSIYKKQINHFAARISPHSTPWYIKYLAYSFIGALKLYGNGTVLNLLSYICKWINTHKHARTWTLIQASIHQRSNYGFVFPEILFLALGYVGSQGIFRAAFSASNKFMHMSVMIILIFFSFSYFHDTSIYFTKRHITEDFTIIPKQRRESKETPLLTGG